MSKVPPRFFKDYQKVGKKLLPGGSSTFHNFLSKGGQFIEVSHINDIIPEIIWLAYLNENLGLINTLDLLFSLLKKANSLNSDGKPINVFLSTFNNLDASQKVLLFKALTFQEKQLLYTSLIGFASLFPDVPISFLFPQLQARSIEKIDRLKATVSNLYYKNNKEYVLALAHLDYQMIASGQLIVNARTKYPDPAILLEYPNTEESVSLAGRLRANCLICKSMTLGNGSTEWKKYFWKTCLQLEPILI